MSQVSKLGRPKCGAADGPMSENMHETLAVFVVGLQLKKTCAKAA